jgi:integral membrane protein
VALAEGISFLVLLGIAMPLKYFANMPMAVTIVGGLHGVLFVAFIILAIEVKSDYKKDFKWLLKAGLASILPFGTIIMDKEWKKEEAAAKQFN